MHSSHLELSCTHLQTNERCASVCEWCVCVWERERERERERENSSLGNVPNEKPFRTFLFLHKWELLSHLHFFHHRCFSVSSTFVRKSSVQIFFPKTFRVSNFRVNNFCRKKNSTGKKVLTENFWNSISSHFVKTFVVASFSAMPAANPCQRW